MDKKQVTSEIMNSEEKRENLIRNIVEIIKSNRFMILFILIRSLVWTDPVGGWPSLVCIICMVSGVQLFCLGIVGQYLSKTYLEVKKRPIYLVKEEI